MSSCALAGQLLGSRWAPFSAPCSHTLYRLQVSLLCPSLPTSPAASEEKAVCVHWLAGSCTRGAKCRFLHPENNADSQRSEAVEVASPSGGSNSDKRHGLISHDHLRVATPRRSPEDTEGQIEDDSEGDDTSVSNGSATSSAFTKGGEAEEQEEGQREGSREQEREQKQEREEEGSQQTTIATET